MGQVSLKDLFKITYYIKNTLYPVDACSQYMMHSTTQQFINLQKEVDKNSEGANNTHRNG